MAVDDLKDDDQEDGAAKSKGKKPIVKILLIVLGALLAVGLIVGATLFAVNGMPGGGKSESQGGSEKQASKGSDQSSKGEGEGEGKAQYFAFDTPFVVNFEDQASLRFLQIGLELMVKNPETIEALKDNMPVIKNTLILLFSSQDYQSISTREGKERIRAQTLSEIQKILKEKTGDPGVEAVYFTSFVMQ